MARVIVLAGTRKGCFLLESDVDRREWSVRGPFCEGWPVYHAVHDAETDTIYAAAASEWHGAGVWRSADRGETWELSSEGLSYGAVVGAIYTYSKTLTVGVGAAAFRQVNRTQVFPFVIVNWQITDKLLLSNPLEAGPTGGPGVELTYEISEPWDVGIGVAFRDTRFRLRRDGPTPNGIGQDKGVPIFAHLAFSPSQALTFDFYAGAIVGGNMRVLDSNGATLSSSDYSTQPVLGIRASYAF